MVRPLVVGVDGSDAGFLAFDWAMDEAALHELPLRLVYASRWERYEDAALGLSLKRPAGWLCSRREGTADIHHCGRRSRGLQRSNCSRAAAAPLPMLSGGTRLSRSR
ncbi:universal stress protein [Streptomyces inhibens]|uniref:universal stress protein n=1 Tax=Streptomyces inhibens TaxID=2293571 RepID=UPI003CC9AC55